MTLQNIIGDFSIWVFIGVTFSITLTSIARSMHVIECAARHSFRAGFWSMVIMVTQSLAIISTTKSALYIVAIGLGAWIGAQGAVMYRYSNHRRKRRRGSKTKFIDQVELDDDD